MSTNTAAFTPIATVNLTVDPIANTWTYALGSGNSQSMACTSQFADVPKNTQGSITVNISSSNSSYTVAFQSAPLSFPNGTPSWYSYSLAPGNAQATINDNNNPSSATSTTYQFNIQAAYTPVGGKSATNFTSPDPTIVNAGTGGYHRWHFPVAQSAGQERERVPAQV